jgi:CxxC motif-containing protein (DUF1111 family)
MMLLGALKKHFSNIFLLLFLFLLSLQVLLHNAFAGTNYQGRSVFSQPANNLDDEQRLNFTVGRGLFRRLWVTAPASTQAADGLGPLYNARSCMACHPGNARGAAPTMLLNESGYAVGELLLRIDVPAQNNKQRQQLADFEINNVPEPNYGIQMQDSAIPGHLAEFKLSLEYEYIPVSFPDGMVVNLRKPTYSMTQLAYGPLHNDARISPRVPPQMIGLGLLEAIDEREIIKQEDPFDKDEDGISGRANLVWSHEYTKTTLGRFGYKAGMPSINQQVQSAFSIDLGLSVPLYKSAAGDCALQQKHCREAPNGNSMQYDNLEANQNIVDLVNLYVSYISVPPRRDTDNTDIKKGEKIFHQIGCQKCHTPHYVTSNNALEKLNRNKEIEPYTDLLLHDMGVGLADKRPEGKATGVEWRTAPLWGIALNEQVNNQSHYLHDGRAQSVLEAILWHGGEAQLQRDAVINLDQNERKKLLTFLESL